MNKKIFAYFIAPGFILFLLGTYLLAPDFYLTYILQKAAREQQVVEMITFSCCLLAGISLLHSGCLLWNKRKPFNAQWGALLVFLLAFAALFFGSEEISWGQTYLGWDTPSKYAQVSVETNLHNTDISVQSLGSFFIISVFFILPLLARYWKKLSSIFAGIEIGVPQSPAIFCMASAFVWKSFKSLYRLFISESARESSAFYLEFVEQLNEQKEMLVAVGLLIYALNIFGNICQDIQKKSS